jgi:general secretion pathway protein L
MSILVVLIPPRPREGAAAPADPAERAAGEFTYALSPDGLAIGSHGRAPVAELPRADTIVAVLPDSDVGWHRVTLPKAPASRLRAALIGMLEESLLEEPEDTHLALAPGAAAGQLTWVAAVHKPWLMQQLALLARADREVDRVVPASWPDEVALGHFAESADTATAGTEQMTLVWSDANGVACLGVQGTLARSMLPAHNPEAPVRWTATPAVAAPAERWLGVPVLVLTAEQRALQATRSLWNLRQFDLAPHHRGTRVLRDAWLRFRSPGWRPVRWGLIGLVALNVVGLNLWAWHLRATAVAKKQAMVQLLQTTYPNVRVVLDAPTQMRRATEDLRTAAGKPGDTDLEPMLQAAAAAWPADRPPVDTLHFEPGKLTLSANGWTPEQITQFGNQLRASGWQVETTGGQIVITRGRAEASA